MAATFEPLRQFLMEDFCEAEPETSAWQVDPRCATSSWGNRWAAMCLPQNGSGTIWSPRQTGTSPLENITPTDGKASTNFTDGVMGNDGWCGIQAGGSKSGEVAHAEDAFDMARRTERQCLPSGGNDIVSDCSRWQDQNVNQVKETTVEISECDWSELVDLLEDDESPNSYALSDEVSALWTRPPIHGIGGHIDSDLEIDVPEVGGPLNIHMEEDWMQSVIGADGANRAGGVEVEGVQQFGRAADVPMDMPELTCMGSKEMPLLVTENTISPVLIATRQTEVEAVGQSSASVFGLSVGQPHGAMVASMDGDLQQARQVFEEAQSLAEDSSGVSGKRKRKAWDRQKLVQEQKRGKAVCRKGPAKSTNTSADVRPGLAESGSILSQTGDVFRAAASAALEGESSGKVPKQPGRTAGTSESSGGSTGEGNNRSRKQRIAGIAADGNRMKASDVFPGRLTSAAQEKSKQVCAVDKRIRAKTAAGGSGVDVIHSQISAPASDLCPCVSAWSPASSQQGSDAMQTSGMLADGSLKGHREVNGGNESGDDDNTKRLQRLIRNRASASESRLRKKSYIYELEGKCAALESQMNSLRQLASITAMENGVLRDQLTRFQQYYGHCAGGMQQQGVPGGMPPAPGPPVMCPPGSGGPDPHHPAAFASGDMDHAQMELSGDDQCLSGSPKKGTEKGNKAEPAVLESDSLPSESLPRLSYLPSLAALTLLLSLLLALSLGLFLPLASLFLPLLCVLSSLAADLPLVDSVADVAQRKVKDWALGGSGSSSLWKLASVRDPDDVTVKVVMTPGQLRRSILTWKMLLSWLRIGAQRQEPHVDARKKQSFHGVRGLFIRDLAYQTRPLSF